MIQDKVSAVLADLHTAARKVGRNPSEITLVAVTKYAPLEAIEEAIKAGVGHIAENRVQEAERKFPPLIAKFPQVRSHIIGHLQTNKAKDAIVVASMIQSVDSLKLANEIQKRALVLNKAVDILVQFNTAHEEQKFGAVPEEAMTLLESIGQLSQIRVKGLMTMAPYTDDQGIIRRTFADLRLIKEQAIVCFKGHERLSFDVMSMGMSGDYQIAIEEGSTMIRVGSAIFKEVMVNVP